MTAPPRDGAFAAASRCCRACSRSPICSVAGRASSTRCAASLATAAPFIGVAMVLDMLDGRIARMTGTASEFGVQLDSLADVISFGMAPAVLAYAWGLAPLGRLGWAAGFLFVTGAALRLARFNIQKNTDKRYFVGLASPAAAAHRGLNGVLLPRRPAQPAAGVPRRGPRHRPGAVDGQHAALPQLQDDRLGARRRYQVLIRSRRCWR